METNRQTTVLFADIAGSTKLYETAGDAAAHAAIDACLGKVKVVTEEAGGRVVKTIGDEVMALFPTPDAAGTAAAAMHAAMATLPEVGGTKMGLRIGFQAGPVIQRDNDVFGDTVNLASRLVDQAVKGQIITSDETASMLGPIFRAWTRKLYPIDVKGKAGGIVLCELVWAQSAEVTTFARTHAPQARPNKAVLRLVYHDKQLVRRRDVESVSIGRDESCGLPVLGTKASRQHCSIERRQDKYLLKDHSTNGTYVTVEGDVEVLLQREEFTLRKHGWIAFGEPRAAATEIVEYFCE